MKFKWNWGWGIAIFYGSFMIITVSFVIYSTGFNRDLVSDTYYEEDQTYQVKQDKIENSEALSDTIAVVQVDNRLVLSFPKELNTKAIKGQIHLFRPSAKIHDRFYDLEVAEDFTQTIDLADAIRGAYRLKIDWQADDVDYYNEILFKVE